MRIAEIAPIVERIPPKAYGGTERVIHALTEELVRRGHQVTLFASGDSQTSAKLSSVYPRNLREAKFKDMYGLNIWSVLNIGEAYSRQAEFDVIHDHTGYFGLPAAQMASTPSAFTYHGPLTREVRTIFSRLNRPHLVTISHSQREQAPELNHLGTVYNGLPMDDYPFSKEHDGYLLFVGRISMEKGVHHAMKVAQHLDEPMIIAAKLDPIDLPYFKEHVEPLLSNEIRWIGEVGEEERNKLYSRAKAFLHPVSWPEPFGLTLIEAMACGCPVIAFSRGSIPELIKHEKTGFVVNTLDDMIDAVENVERIDRAACRDHARNNFSAAAMADGYEKVFEEIARTKK
jgi:glycosyltransferase involved in cell wall biosynthesis